MEDRSGGIARTTAVERTSSTGFDEVEVCELRLLDAVRDGHPEAFGALYERHHDAVFCLARRLTRDKYEADDVVSEVFCNTLRAIRNGGGPRDEAKPYLLRSVRHTVTNMHTRKDTGRATPMANDDLDRADTHDPYPMGGPATDAYLDVSDRFRDVLWATEVDGAGTADVAAAQHISGPAAASLAYRARRALRRSYLRGCIRVPVVSDDCLETRALLPAFVDGDTATPGADRVRKHIATCPTCDGVLVQLNSVHDRLSNRSWFVVSAGALRWLTADGGRTLVGVIGTSPVVIAAGLGVGALVTTVHSDTSPDRTEAARATEVVVVTAPPADPRPSAASDPAPTSAAPTQSSGPGPVVGPAAGSPSAEPAGAPTPASGTGSSGATSAPGTGPIGSALPTPGHATGTVPGGIDNIVTGGVAGPVAGAGTVVGETVEGVTSTVEATTSSVLGVVEGTAGAVVGVPSAALGLVEPVLAAVPAVGQVTAPVGPLVDQLSATELAVVATTVDQLNATTNGALVAINTTTTELTGPLLSHD